MLKHGMSKTVSTGVLLALVIVIESTNPELKSKCMLEGKCKKMLNLPGFAACPLMRDASATNINTDTSAANVKRLISDKSEKGGASPKAVTGRNITVDTDTATDAADETLETATAAVKVEMPMLDMITKRLFTDRKSITPATAVRKSTFVSVGAETSATGKKNKTSATVTKEKRSARVVKTGRAATVVNIVPSTAVMTEMFGTTVPVGKTKSISAAALDTGTRPALPTTTPLLPSSRPLQKCVSSSHRSTREELYVATYEDMKGTTLLYYCEKDGTLIPTNYNITAVRGWVDFAIDSLSCEIYFAHLRNVYITSMYGQFAPKTMETDGLLSNLAVDSSRRLVIASSWKSRNHLKVNVLCINGTDPGYNRVLRVRRGGRKWCCSYRDHRLYFINEENFLAYVDYLDRKSSTVLIVKHRRPRFIGFGSDVLVCLYRRRAVEYGVTAYGVRKAMKHTSWGRFYATRSLISGEFEVVERDTENRLYFLYQNKYGEKNILAFSSPSTKKAIHLPFVNQAHISVG